MGRREIPAEEKPRGGEGGEGRLERGAVWGAAGRSRVTRGAGRAGAVRGAEAPTGRARAQAAPRRGLPPREAAGPRTRTLLRAPSSRRRRQNSL